MDESMGSGQAYGLGHVTSHLPASIARSVKWGDDYDHVTCSSGGLSEMRHVESCAPGLAFEGASLPPRRPQEENIPRGTGGRTEVQASLLLSGSFPPPPTPGTPGTTSPFKHKFHPVFFMVSCHFMQFLATGANLMGLPTYPRLFMTPTDGMMALSCIIGHI